MTAREVLDVLAEMHPAGREWTFAREFERVDGYALRLFQGSDRRTYRRVAYEVKVSRSDFLGELKNPEKRVGALGLSHQFYFAMPHELACACLADVMRHVPEAGLIAVQREAYDPPNFHRSACVGASWSPYVRVLRKAPIRDCQPLSMRLMTNLIRRDQDGDVLHLRHELRAARERTKLRGRDMRKARGQRDRALAAIEELLGHTVEAGDVFKGDIGRHSRFPGRGKVVVSEVQKWGSLPATVRVVRLGPDGEPTEGRGSLLHIKLAEFLADFRPLSVEKRVADVRMVV